MWNRNISQRATVWTFVIIAVLSQWTNATPIPSDPCTALANKAVVPYEDAKACLDSFPFDLATATETINTLTFVLDKLYPYNEIATAPPPVMNISLPAVDTLTELRALLNQSWSTERAFHDAADIILERLQDAHTTYHPTCYRQFYFMQTIQINSIVRDGKQIIQVAWIRSDFFPEAKSDWVGCEVTHIDGKPALQYVIDYAVNVGDGLSKDAHVRFNNLLNSYTFAKQWETAQDRLGMQTRLPNSPSINYTIACPSQTFDIVAPWVAIIPKVESSSQYRNAYCKTSPVNRLYKKRESEQKAPLKRWFDEAENPKHLVKRTNDSAGFVFVAESTKAQYFVLTGSNADVGVIHLSGFHDDDKFMPVFVNVLKSFAASGVKKIVFDVSNNGGGIICLGNYMTKTFFPNEKQFPSDIKYSDLLSRVVQKSYDYLNSKGQHVTYYTRLADSRDPLQLLQNASWMTNPATYTRGGKQVRFSQPVTLYCPPFSTLPLSHQFVNNYWKASDMIIVSNGLCGSTCSIVTTHLREEFGVPTVGLGGIWGQPMSYSSFPGGQVTNLHSFIGDLASLGMQSDPEALKPLPLNGGMTWAGREAYLTHNPGTPLEYESFPADCRLPITDENEKNPAVVWHEVANLLKSGQCPLGPR